MQTPDGDLSMVCDVGMSVGGLFRPKKKLAPLGRFFAIFGDFGPAAFGEVPFSANCLVASGGVIKKSGKKKCGMPDATRFTICMSK